MDVQEPTQASGLEAIALTDFPSAVVVTDLLGTLLVANEEFRELPGRPDMEQLLGEYSGQYRDMLERTYVEGRSGERFDIFYQPAEGQQEWLRVSIRKRQDRPELVHSLEYVTDLKDAALKDPLTGAPNKRAFADDCEEIVSSYLRDVRGWKKRTMHEPEGQHGPGPGEPAMLYLDIDHFKKINDEYGHAVGDQVLTQLVDRIRGVLRAEERVYRIGGEEFAIPLRRGGLEGAKVVGEKIRLAIAEKAFPVEYGGTKDFPPLPVSISVGVSQYEPGHPGQDPVMAIQQWHKRADDALYSAKNGIPGQSGRNQIHFWSPDLRGPVPYIPSSPGR